MKDLRDWVDVGFKITLALAGVVVGYYFSFQRQQNDDIKLIIEMVSSEQPLRRELGWSIAESYKNQDRLPDEVYLAVYKYVSNGQDEKLVRIVRADVAAAVKNDEALQTKVAQVDSGLPVRIYFHIRQEQDRARANELARALETSVTDVGAIDVPGVELKSSGPDKSELRCFKKAECTDLAPKLLQSFKDSSFGEIELRDLSQRYENSKGIRPKHFEVWFAALATADAPRQ